MSDIAMKLSVLAKKKQTLLEEEGQLLAQRKAEIGELAARIGLLEVSNELIAGLFVDAKQALLNQADKLSAWEGQGSTFLKGKRYSPKTQKSAQGVDAT